MLEPMPLPKFWLGLEPACIVARFELVDQLAPHPMDRLPQRFPTAVDVPGAGVALLQHCELTRNRLSRAAEKEVL